MCEDFVIPVATALAGTELRKLSSNDRRNTLISARVAIKAHTAALIAAGYVIERAPRPSDEPYRDAGV